MRHCASEGQGSSHMTVTDITVTPLKIGKGLLRIQTDAGVEGYAEVYGRNNSVFNAYLESRIT